MARATFLLDVGVNRRRPPNGGYQLLSGREGTRITQTSIAAGEDCMSERISAEALSDVIGSIYDCALDPDHWPAALEKLRKALAFHNALLALNALPSGLPLLIVSSGIEQKWLDLMPDYAADLVDQWGGHEAVARLPLDEPAVLSRQRTQAQIVANRYYAEWGRPQYLCDVMGITLSRDAASIGTLGLGRHETQGMVGTREIEAARLLIPHLQRAIAIGKVLDMKTVATAAFEAALDVQAAGIFLVDADLRIRHANRAAASLLLRGDIVSSERGTLAIRLRTSHATLALAVRQAFAEEAALDGRAFGIPVPSAEGRPAILHVLPLRHGKLRPDLSPAAAAVFVSTGAAPTTSDALAALFDLTAAEARVLAHIALGRTVAETASLLGVEPSTAKTHLLRVFSKTGTRRQAELIKLVDSLAPPV